MQTVCTLCDLPLNCAGSTSISSIEPKNNLYLQMSVNTAALFEQKFGPHPRFDPAHAPRLLKKRYLQELQQKIPEEFERTSAAKLRCDGRMTLRLVRLVCVGQIAQACRFQSWTELHSQLC
jgi:hypothetical protein